MPFGTHDTYRLESGLDPIQWPAVHAWLAGSYWCPGISLEQLQRAASNSTLVLSAFAADGAQAGFLRVLSDKVRFAYLCDVWVDERHRKRGLARAMVRSVIDHPDFATTRWLLVTADAHGVYSELEFEALKEPWRWMLRNPRRPLVEPKL